MTELLRERIVQPASRVIELLVGSISESKQRKPKPRRAIQNLAPISSCLSLHSSFRQKLSAFFQVATVEQFVKERLARGRELTLTGRGYEEQVQVPALHASQGAVVVAEQLVKVLITHYKRRGGMYRHLGELVLGALCP